jgi:hypothetical protein
VLLLLGFWGIAHYRTLAARRDWKENAIPFIANFANDKDLIREEVALISDGDPTQEDRIIAEQWLSDRMILMESGEWLVYQSHCHKAPPHNVKDIFIAKGSNGKWYYTTCHFCVGMVALTMNQMSLPADLEYFVERYHLQEFDGRSNECLKETKTFPDPLID